MLEVLVEQRFYVTAVLLFSVGLAALLLHPNLIKKIIGLNLMDTAVFLFLAAMGYVDGGKAPWGVRGGDGAAYLKRGPGGGGPPGWVGGGTPTALFLALTHRLYQKYHSVNLDVILMLARRGTEEE